MVTLIHHLPRLKCEVVVEHSPVIAREMLRVPRFDVVVIRATQVQDEVLGFLNHVKFHTAIPPVILILEQKKGDEDLDVIAAGATDFLLAPEISGPLLERSIRFSLFRSRFRTEIQEREIRIMMNERLASIGLLASGMAHEIGTPLGVIRGRAEVLLMKNKGNESLGRDLGIVIKQVDRISKLMKSLLNLARGDESRRTGVIDLREVVSEVLEVMGANFRLHEIQVFTDIPMSLRVPAQADHDPFHQILCNLFQNSIQAIERARQGGKLGPHQVRVTLASTLDLWILSVTDTGCGISDDEKKKLFRPFFSTKGIGGGLGLGLALTQRIVESWKGVITVESELGQGASFHLSIPKEVAHEESLSSTL